jgi:threonine aldolase
VQTNIFFATLLPDTLSPRAFVAALRERGILVSPPRGEGRTVRLVTHFGVTRDDIATTLSAVAEILAEAAAPSDQATTLVAGRQG